MSDDPEVLLGVRQVAALFDCHENTIRNWTDEGRLAYVTKGAAGYRRYPAKAVGVLLRSGIAMTGPVRPPDEVVAAAEDDLAAKLVEAAGTLAQLLNAVHVRQALRRRR